VYCQVPVSLLRGAYCGIIICRFGNMICMHGGGQSRKGWAVHCGVVGSGNPRRTSPQLRSRGRSTLSGRCSWLSSRDEARVRLDIFIHMCL
jgi:hypothetical protein